MGPRRVLVSGGRQLVSLRLEWEQMSERTKDEVLGRGSKLLMNGDGTFSSLLSSSGWMLSVSLRTAL